MGNGHVFVIRSGFAHDNRHRVYEPAIGRYISADPIGQFGLLASYGVPRVSTFALWGSQYAPVLGAPGREQVQFDGGTNIYGYVVNDPVNLFDPLGLYPGEGYVNSD